MKIHRQVSSCSPWIWMTHYGLVANQIRYVTKFSMQEYKRPTSEAKLRTTLRWTFAKSVFPHCWIMFDDQISQRMGMLTYPACPTFGDIMKARIDQSQTGKSILVTFLEGFSTYTITVPMPYAVRFFAEGARTSLEVLKANKDLQSKLGFKEGERAEILENLRRSLTIYDDLVRELTGD